MKQFFCLVIAAAALLSCGGGRTAPLADEPTDSIAFKYARLIHVAQYDGYRLVTIDNPWKPGKALHRYILVPYGAIPSHPQGTVVRTPLQKSIIFTSVHAALVDQLNAREQVAGVADLKYIKVPFVQEGCREGCLIDCGDGMNPLVEKIIDAQADAILLSPFENSGGYGRIEDVDIPLIECAEYMEASPLARAEWMRFYGMLYGREREADSLFAIVDSNYHALCLQAKEAGKGRSVLVDKQTGSVWYVPGGRSTIGQMLVDAGADYAFASDDRSGSLSLPFETVLERAGESDVWIFRYDSPRPITLTQLLAEQPGYRQLRPVRERVLYGCNVMTSMFYEETPFRPDLLLQDFIQILHPDITNLPPLRYYHKVE
ncbi:MAG: ABC transporter substrate-binding protein [Prevotella sp.]|nr:ABC transporter substrate-binding protein [Prevotella sp.]